MIARMKIDKTPVRRNGHLVVPCGGRLESGAATRFAFQLADQLGARLTLVHVKPHIDTGEGFEGIGAVARLHRVLRMPPSSSQFTPTFADRAAMVDWKEPPTDRQLTGRNSNLRFVFRTGDLVARLVEVHQADPVDLFIVQPQKRRWFSWFRFSGIDRDIQAATDCPVVVVPKRWKPASRQLEPVATVVP